MKKKTFEILRGIGCLIFITLIPSLIATMATLGEAFINWDFSHFPSVSCYLLLLRVGVCIVAFVLFMMLMTYLTEDRQL